VPAGFIPESEFDPVPHPELVVDNAQVVLDYALADTDGFCDFTVFQSLGNKLDYPEFSFVGNAITVALCKHNYLPIPNLRGGDPLQAEGELTGPEKSSRLSGAWASRAIPRAIEEFLLDLFKPDLAPFMIRSVLVAMIFPGAVKSIQLKDSLDLLSQLRDLVEAEHRHILLLGR
jgi:hypothetical protein